MPAPLQQITISPELPTSADAVIIGGGIVGVFAAYYLARRGLKVALVEKGLIGAIQPQLGLVPPAEPRRPRIADFHQEPGALGRVWRRERRGHGFSPLRAVLPERQ